jgi:hypothetical protein
MEGVMMAKCNELCWQLPEYHMNAYQCNVLHLKYNIYLFIHNCTHEVERNHY